MILMGLPVDNTFFLKLVIKDIPSVDEDVLAFRLFEIGAFGLSRDLKFKQESHQYDPEVLNQDLINLQAFFHVAKKEELEKNFWIKDYKNEFFVEKNKDWLEEWKKHFKAFGVFRGLWIVPSWEKETFKPPQDEGLCIFIEPGLAFGTGTHATTKLCLKAISGLLDSTSQISKAFDLGSGSSILSIYLKKKGVDEVKAFDIEPLARENGLHNLNLNGIKDVKIYVSENDVSDEEEFNLVVANIIDGVLLKLKESILSKKAEYIILSGILRENKDKLVEAFTHNTGYSLISLDHLEEWSLILLKKV